MSSPDPIRAVLEIQPHDHRVGSLGGGTLIEYGDYECDDCGATFPTLRRVQRLLADEACFVFRHFPLARHLHAMPAAEAAEAAGAQGRFWEMHDLLFDRQTELERADLLRYAREVDLDVERFEREIDAHVHVPRITEDLESGRICGVRGTPTLFVNGTRWRAPVTVPLLMEALRGTSPPF